MATKTLLEASIHEAITDAPTKMFKAAWPQSTCKDLMKTRVSSRSLTWESTILDQHSGQQSLHQQQSSDMLLNQIRAGLGNRTRNLHHAPHDQSFANSFHFPSTSDLNTKQKDFPSTMIDNKFTGDFRIPSYALPITSATSILETPSGGKNFKGTPNVDTC